MRSIPRNESFDNFMSTFLIAGNPSSHDSYMDWRIQFHCLSR